MTDSNQTPQPEQRPAYDRQLEERGIDPLSIAAAAGIVKAVDMGVDYVGGKIAAARRPPEPPPADAPKVLPPGADPE